MLSRALRLLFQLVSGRLRGRSPASLARSLILHNVVSACRWLIMADSNHLKRPFAQVASDHKLPHPHSVLYEIHSSLSVETSTSSSPSTAAKRRSRSLSRTDIRRQAGLRSLPSSDSFPSFMSALGVSRRSHNEAQGDSSLGTKAIVSMGPPSSVVMNTTRTRAASHTRPFAPVTHPEKEHSLYPGHGHVSYPSGPIHYPREYVSVASESTDSSPTTTSSTFDSPIIVDPSPSSSPESPTSLPPLASIKPSSYAVSGDMHTRPPSADAFMSSIRSEAPKKGRNLKNLSLRLPPPNQSCPTLCTAPIREPQQIGAPVPVPRTSRRRPTNLTIQTPGLDRSFSTGILSVVPPTPSTRPSLRRFESSPSLQTAFSPPDTAVPSQVKERRNSSHDTYVRSKFVSNQPLQALGEEDDSPVSRESAKANEKGYPDGPILIYDSGLYLYAEPNREEASNFDCVFNVAKEVANPFKGVPKNDKQTTVMSVWKTAIDSGPGTTPCTARSDATFKTAVEFVSDESPTTPRADKQPEYIHVPWDHNSEILDDLYTLCEMIDERISKGKKVLIHCQLGVSRSASLVIAYGLYKNPHLDFNSVYSIVKGRSSWVGPNMSLIYQLTDFRSRVKQGGPTKPPPEEWFKEMSETDSTTGPLAAPESKPDPALLANLLSPSAMRDTFAIPRPATSGGTRRGVSPRPLPLREKYPTIHAFQPTSRPSAMSLYPQESSSHTDLDTNDIPPPTPAIFSPKATEFLEARTRTSLTAGDLAFHHRISIDGAAHPAPAQPSLMADPRSPQQQREPFIMRNIDEFL